MAFSKIILNGTTLIDLTSDTVAVDNLISPNTAHNNAGVAITGTASGGTTPVLQTITKSYTPTESQQTETITAGSGYDAIGEVDVTVGAISSYYVGSNIPQNTVSNVTFIDDRDGKSVMVDSGYYGSDIIKTLPVGSVTAPSTISGSSATVSTGTNTLTLTKTVSVTPNVTTAGYISSGTSGNSSVSLTASVNTRSSSDLTASGATVTAPAGYYANQATKSVASGTVTAPSSISGTSATVSTGTNTLTLTKTVSVTPSVTTAGYVSSGTAGNSSVSLTASVTTKAATTYHPSTSDQTIASGTYTTGTQTIKAVTTTNLSAGNIASGVVVKVGDSTDDDCVTSVTGSLAFVTYFSGTGNPSSSTGSNGDIYLKTVS